MRRKVCVALALCFLLGLLAGCGPRKAQQQELIVTEDDWAKHPGDDWEFQASVIEFSMICRDSEYVGDADMEMVLETLDALDEEGALDADREGFYELVKMAY